MRKGKLEDEQDSDDDESSSSYESREEFEPAVTESITEEEEESSVNEETIGVFGPHGPTGKHLIKLALDAGYVVRALAPANAMEFQHNKLTVIEGSFDDPEKVEQVLIGATFCVCLLGETLPKNKQYPKRALTNFCKRLYPLMNEHGTKLFLYQANSLTVDNNGKVPVFSKVVKRAASITSGGSAAVKDNDAAVKYIVEHGSPDIRYIVTRPGLVRDGASKKHLAASRSLPGPVPITNADLAEFSLEALLEEKLYDTCPYVLGDGF